jgi:hypothetical protein
VAQYTLSQLLINIARHSCSVHDAGVHLYAPTMQNVLFHQAKRTLNMYDYEKKSEGYGRAHLKKQWLYLTLYVI